MSWLAPFVRGQIHDKAQETEQCEEVYQAAAKKFRHSKKVSTRAWILTLFVHDTVIALILDTLGW